jgi:hypothetical protein
MAIADMIPGLEPKALATLRDNALRLQQTGTPRQRAEAEALMPAIDAELAERKAKAPPTARARLVAKAGPKAPAKPRKPAKPRAKAKAKVG